MAATGGEAIQMEEGKVDVEDNKSNGETEPKAPTSKLINENAATDTKPLKEKEPEAANGKFTQISSTFFGFLKNLEKKVCDKWESTSTNTKRVILGISVLLFLIILIALIGVASTGSSCDTDSEPNDPKCGNESQEKVDLETDVILNQISNKRDVSPKWISDDKLKYQDADGNINIFNSVDEKSTKFIPFQTLNGYKKIKLSENNVFYTDGDGQVNVGPLPPSDAKQIKDCFDEDNLYKSPYDTFICFGNCQSSGGYNLCQDPDQKSAENFIKEGGNKYHSVSSDEEMKYVLVEKSKEKIFRHSYTARYSVVHITQSVQKEIISDDFDEGSIQMVQWSPKFVSMALVANNNLFYLKDGFDPKTYVQITDNGEKDVIFNGVADHLYEEEILEQSRAFWFSKNGEKLLYATFDASNVHEVTLDKSFKQSEDCDFFERRRRRKREAQDDYPDYPSDYEGSGGGDEYDNYYGGSGDYPDYPDEGGLPKKFDQCYNSYGTQKTIRYAKAGTVNSNVTLTVVTNLETNEKTIVTRPTELQGDDLWYFTSVNWLDDNSVIITWMDRLQKEAIVSKCSGPDYQCEKVYSEKSEAWMELRENKKRLVFSKDQGAVYMLAIRSVNNWPQIVKKNIDDSSDFTEITNGGYAIEEILGWDKVKNEVYFLASMEKSENHPDKRHVYKISTNSNTPEECLTCEKFDTGLPKCEYAQGKVSPNFTHFLLECLGPKVPYTVLVSLTSKKIVETLEDNKDTKSKLEKVNMPSVEFRKFELPGTNTPARVKLILPPCFDDKKKYPLIVDLYGGPGVQFVTKKWRQHSREGIDYYLAGKKNYIVAKIDVRGTGFSGDEFHHAVKEQLGIVERDDTIKVIEDMVDSLGYIDESRVGVWGWSYGGYLTAQILAKEQKYVNCGVAIAPVSQWELYDSGYTERYMGYPSSRGETPGYPEDSGLRTKGSSFKGKNLYLVHGSADDNVHIQNTDILSQALVKENIQFKLQIYPGANHDLNYMDLDGNSVDALKHLYTSMEDFFDKDCNFADENSKAREIERLKEELRVLKQI